MNKHTTLSGRRQQGSIIVLFGGLLLVLTGFAVLAIDVGRIYIVRSELQNVADASALAGANCLTRNSSTVSTTDCLNTLSAPLNWDRAVAKAQGQLGQNQADNRSISSSDAGHVIDVGYWDLLNKRPAGGTLPSSALSTSFSPLGSYDKPAIRVKVSKATGQNGGPILMLTRLMFGGVDVAMSATAVAVISSPASVPAGRLIPMAINKCMYDTYWNSSSNTPYNATSVTLNGVAQVIGKPWVFDISNTTYGSCLSAQWTSFGVTDQSASYVDGLIANGNPTALSIGDPIFIQSTGLRTSAYNKLPINADVILPVVTINSQGAFTPILAFAVFHITAITTQGSIKYVEGYFKSGLTVSGSSGIGPSYGAYTPPRLAY